MKTSVKNHRVGARPRGRIAKAIAAVAFVGLFAAACNDATGPETLSSLTVAPTTQTVAVGGTVQLEATGVRAGIDVTNLVGEEWSVTGGGTVSDSGLFTAGTTPGTSTITVTCGGRTATATITVTAGPLASITVTPNPGTIQIGMTQQFTAVGRDAGGNLVAITPTWSVVAGGGTIAAGTGLFTAGNSAGTFTNTVTATQGTISGTATAVVSAGPLVMITVTPDPESLVTNEQQQFTAIGTDAGGNIVAINPTWSVAAGGGTIVAGSGLFTAGTTIGTYPNTVTATQGTISGTASVVVTSGPLVTITVTPNPESLGVGEQQQFTATGTDVNGNVVVLVPVWTVVAGGGTINSRTGLFTAGSTLGTFTNTVVATQGSLFGRATVTVTSGALATITVTPNPVTLAVRQSQPFTAVGRDAAGNVVPIEPTWSATSTAGTIESGSGRFTAGSTPGTYANGVTATQGSISGSATVTVTTGALATITVSPNPATLVAGGQQTFTAVGRDLGGNVVPITPVWSATSPPGTINSGTGVFTAGGTLGTFNNAVTATQGTISGSATVIVTAPPVPSGSPIAVLANTSVTCTEGVVNGQIGTVAPAGITIVTSCTNSGLEAGTPAAVSAYNAFLDNYTVQQNAACGTMLVGTLAGQVLPPGVYCFAAGATLTGLLTLNGPSDGVWLFKVGATSPGSLSATNFDVVMAGGGNRCNVTWWSQGASTMTDTDLLGNVLAAANATFTRGTAGGNVRSKTNAIVTETVITGCT